MEDKMKHDNMLKDDDAKRGWGMGAPPKAMPPVYCYLAACIQTSVKRGRPLDMEIVSRRVVAW